MEPSDPGRRSDGEPLWLRSAAHELKNPLAAVAGAAEFLVEDRDRLEPEHRQLVDLIDRNVHRAIRLVDDLLLLARIDRGELRVDETLVRPADVAARAVARAEPAARDRGVSFEIDGDPGVEVRSDPVHLEHILDHLLANAASHAEPGAPVFVRVRRDEGGVSLSVEDSGPGVPEAERERIFRRFARGARSAGGGGAGLGLAIVRELGRRLGGEVELRANARGGSDFVLRLPG